MTDNDKTLVERLRAYPAGPVFQPEGYADALHLEAADRIEALSAEIERLREALEKIIKMYPDDGSLQWACAITARAALGETK